MFHVKHVHVRQQVGGQAGAPRSGPAPIRLPDRAPACCRTWAFVVVVVVVVFCCCFS